MRLKRCMKVPVIAAWALTYCFALSWMSTAGAATLPGTATTQDPVVTFTATGLQTVTLNACNALGCSSVSHQVLVLPALPAVTSYSAVPAQAAVGQSITLSAQATGQPPLTYSWLLIYQGLAPVGTLLGATAVWNTAGYPSGSYTIQLTVTGASGVATASTQVVLLAATATRFYTVNPCRVLDTRTTSGPLRSGAAPRVIPVGGTCGIPASATSVAINLTAVGATNTGSLNLYPADYPQPTGTDSSSFSAGQIRATASVLPLSSDGQGALAAQLTMPLGGQVDLVLDVSGYFAPLP